MAIRRMISRDPAEFRAFQSRMTTVGKIRLGIYATPEGRKGRPEKLNTFRFTADNEALIRAVAEEYGGEAAPWTPQGAKAAQWEVITATKAVEVYVVNGQNIDPVYEAWAGGRTCVRRCDGEWEQIKQEACLCTGPNRPRDTRELCKITVRVQVMLQRIQGLGSWLLESHGENAAMELATFGPFIAGAPMPVPAMLRLREETRRQWNPNPDKGDPRFETKNFYVPWFDISAVNARQIAIGGDALTQALSAAGAPAAIGGSAQMAIETRPVSAPIVPVVPTPPAPFDIEGLRPRILLDIEACTTVEALNAIRDKLKARGVDDQQVREAWRSKVNAVGAADVMRMNAAAIASGAGRPYRVLVTGSRTWTDTETLNQQLDFAHMTHRGRMVLVHGACPQGADALADTWAEANGVPVERYPADWDGEGKRAGFIRNQAMVDSRPDIVLSFNRGESNGTEHCTQMAENKGLKVLRFRDNTPYDPPVPKVQPAGIENRQTDRRPCLDPYCANNPDTACGFTPNQHMEHHGAAVIMEANRPEYRVGDTVTVGGLEFTKISDNPFPPGSDAAKMFEYGNGATDENGCYTMPDGSCASTGPCIHTAPVEGTVETTGPVLPDVPDGDYDADELYTMIMTGAGQQVPPLTTAEVNALIVRTTGMQPNRVTGHALAQLRAGLKAGVVTWR